MSHNKESYDSLPFRVFPSLPALTLSVGNCEHSTLGHSLTNENVYKSMFAFFRAVTNKSPRPKMRWDWGISNDTIWAELEILSDLKPISVSIKYAETDSDNVIPELYRRDFRWTVPNATWTSPGQWESDKNENSRVKQEVVIRPIIAHKKRALKISESLYRYETNIPSQGTSV